MLTTLFYFPQFLAGWKRQFLPLLIFYSPYWCQEHSTIEDMVSGVSVQLLICHDQVSKTTSWEINTGGGEFYQYVWIVTVGFAETSISFHSILMKWKNFDKNRIKHFSPVTLSHWILPSEIWVSAFLWIRFISLFSFKLDFGLSGFLSACPYGIILVFLSAKTKVQQKS